MNERLQCVLCRRQRLQRCAAKQKWHPNHTYIYTEHINKLTVNVNTEYTHVQNAKSGGVHDAVMPLLPLLGDLLMSWAGQTTQRAATCSLDHAQ